MATIQVDAERTIAAPPDKVYRCIADYKERRTGWLPPQYSDYAVEQGGYGGGTVYRYLLTVGNRKRTYNLSVSEPAQGSTLVEQDTGSTLSNTWKVSAQGSGSRVTLHTEWQGHGGFGGFMERMFAPRALKGVYEDELARLDRYVTTSK